MRDETRYLSGKITAQIILLWLVKKPNSVLVDLISTRTFTLYLVLYHPFYLAINVAIKKIVQPTIKQKIENIKF